MVITLALEIQHFQASEGFSASEIHLSAIFQLLATMLLPFLYQGEQQQFLALLEPGLVNFLDALERSCV